MVNLDTWFDMAEEKKAWLKWSDLKMGKKLKIYVSITQGYLDLQTIEIVKKDKNTALTKQGWLFYRCKCVKNFALISSDDFSMLKSKFDKMPKCDELEII